MTVVWLIKIIYEWKETLIVICAKKRTVTERAMIADLSRFRSDLRLSMSQWSCLHNLTEWRWFTSQLRCVIECEMEWISVGDESPNGRWASFYFFRIVMLRTFTTFNFLFFCRFSHRICSFAELVCGMLSFMKSLNWKWNAIRCFWIWPEWSSRSKAPLNTWFSGYSRICRVWFNANECR